MSHHPIDCHVGRRIRVRRKLLGLSQTALADKLGLKFQQLQKYENGTNRISASKLWICSESLDVPISFFFDDMPADVAALYGGPLPTDAPDDPMAKREALELVRAFYAIEDRATRTGLFRLAKAMARAGQGDTRPMADAAD